MINLSKKAKVTTNALASLLAAVFLFISFAYLQQPPDFIDGEKQLHIYDLALNIIRCLLCLFLGVVFVRAVSHALFSFLRRRRASSNVPPLLQNVFSFSLYTLLFVLVFNSIFPDVSLGALFTTSAVFGVIIGLALQDTLGNFFSGVSLHADRPFQIGDVITVGKWSGKVESITWRAVKIRTFQNHLVFVSNASIAKEAIEVYPRTNSNARMVFFSARYDASPARVTKAINEAIRETPNLSPTPAPLVRVRAFGDSSVDYEVKYWLEDYAAFNDTDALLRARIWYALARAGIEFAFPTRTLIIESVNASLLSSLSDTTHERQKAQSNDYRASSNDYYASTLRQAFSVPQFQKATRDFSNHSLDKRPQFINRLRAVPLFASLSETELQLLASEVAVQIFAAGETIIHQNDAGSSMFIIDCGTAEVRVAEADGRQTIATLAAGDFFGEMALLTGEPRTASVVARSSEVSVIEVQHASLKHLFEVNQDLVEALSEIAADRQTQLNDSNAFAQPAIQIAQRTSLVASIKRFFNL